MKEKIVRWVCRLLRYPFPIHCKTLLVTGSFSIDPIKVLSLTQEALNKYRVDMKANLLRQMMIALEGNEVISYVGDHIEETNETLVYTAITVVIPDMPNKEHEFKIKYLGYAKDYGLGRMRLEVNVSDDWLKEDYPDDYEMAKAISTKHNKE